MVHALTKAVELVRPGGSIVDVHDSRTPPSIEIIRGTDRTAVGWLSDHEGFPMLRLADEALEKVIDRGLLIKEAELEIHYHTKADSFDAFLEWLDEQWETSYLEAKIERRVRTMFSEGGDGISAIIRRSAYARNLIVA